MGILLDAIVCIGEYKGVEDRPDHPLRLVVVKTTPHEKRGSPASNGLPRIATNVLDVPAWIIALIYRYRWTIDVVFCLSKHVPGCRQLVSHDPVGIESQTYCAIITCMLISFIVAVRLTKQIPNPPHSGPRSSLSPRSCLNALHPPVAFQDPVCNTRAEQDW